jgi:integrase/recombinase XerD
VVFFSRLNKRVGFIGVSSHSGRRSFASRAAKKLTQAGGSLRDVQAMLGHRSLSTTQKHLEQDVEAQRKVVEIVFSLFIFPIFFTPVRRTF